MTSNQEKLSGRINLKQLIATTGMSSNVISISRRREHRMNEIEEMPPKYRRPREEFNFGAESHVRASEIEETLRRTIRTYFKARPPRKNPVLVGYHIDLDLAAMRKDFPAVADHFTALVDLRTIFHSLCPEGSITKELGVGKTLRLFGYGPGDHGGRRRYIYHSAGNDTVKTLALLHALKKKENIRIVITEQCRVSKKHMIDDEKRRNPRRKKHVADSTKRMIIDETRKKPPYQHRNLAVIIAAADNLSSLPDMLRSPHKLAAFLEVYEPSRVGST
ncbi:Uu.00g105080.m01.CDS01 [Anthostomella pinea]|uniref:Uu.00g105080.m01.CDS01 n=1 Tax=Anthostomella pinea TaxID=933095 RepID=A0AAI8VEK2_9PEZI|nr:Uu.00g105080.m01.CDS01 [Anthostomella pinea]